MTQQLMPEMLTSAPYNAHTPVGALAADLTPVEGFFVRNHFPTPLIDRASWRLRIGGAVEAPGSLGFRELLAMPARELDVVLECAGNGRTGMAPQPPGLPWGERAVGCARFRGVPFREIAARCGIAAHRDVCGVVFAGADSGVAHGRQARFERNLPLRAALHPDTLVATHMNSAPLTAEHGAPVRLVVPGAYGVASVKWLVTARFVTRPFRGLFQTEQYVYRDARGRAVGELGPMRVKSLITSPEPGALVPVGRPVSVTGKAWSGAAPVERVELSADGATWRPARVAPASSRYGWVAWTADWTPARHGPQRLLARAVDANGTAQPTEVPWNALGYGNNAVATVLVTASSGRGEP